MPDNLQSDNLVRISLLLNRFRRSRGHASRIPPHRMKTNARSHAVSQAPAAAMLLLRRVGSLYLQRDVLPTLE